MSILLASALLLLVPGASAIQPPVELLKDYQGSERLPPDLYSTYAQLAEAISKAEVERIKQICLPRSVAVTVEPRSIQDEPFGDDINLPYARKSFHKYILFIERLAANAYLIRTGSSTMQFVRTDRSEWRLYRYRDKPIQ